TVRAAQGQEAAGAGQAIATMSSPTQRSLAYLKRQAYLTAVVERFNAAIEFNCQTGAVHTRTLQKEVSMRTCRVIMFCLFLFACKRSGDKLDMSLFDKPATPVVFAAQQCLPPQSAQCGSVCYDPQTYCCCTRQAGGQCLIPKIPVDEACGRVC